MGQKLARICPHLLEEIQSDLESLHSRWNELANLVRSTVILVENDNQDKLIRKAIQNTNSWINHVADQVQELKPSDMTNLDMVDFNRVQTLLKEHDKRQKEYSDRMAVLNGLKNRYLSSEIGNIPQFHELQISLNEVNRKMELIGASLAKKQNQLETLRTLSKHWLEINLEGAWIREKQLQLKNLAIHVDTNIRLVDDGGNNTGQNLLITQQAKRQLNSYLLEATNRRPRVQTFCNNIQEEYSSSDIKNRLEQALKELLNNWNQLDSCLTQLRTRIHLLEVINQFLYDSGELQIWISEQEFYLERMKKPKSEQSALNYLKKHRVQAVAIDKRLEEVNSLEQCGISLMDQLKTCQNNNVSSIGFNKTTSLINLIQNTVDKTRVEFIRLQNLTSSVSVTIEAAIIHFGIDREAQELEIWINKRMTIAKNNELGLDLDHCCDLREKFNLFSKETIRFGSKMVQIISSKCVKLIDLNQTDLTVIAQTKDNLNELWSELLELIDTRKQLLKTALEMHRFVNDCQDFEERILNRLENLPPEPTDCLVSGQKQGLSGLQRSHNLLEQEVKCFSEQLLQLETVTKDLLPRYAGYQSDQLKNNYQRVQLIWNNLLNILEIRRNLLKEASSLHEFLVNARELISWLEYVKDVMECKERPRNLSGVEYLIEDHKNIRSELDSRNSGIENCLNLGRRLLSEIDNTMKSTTMTASQPTLKNSRSEVRDRCVQLATGRLLVMELWRERWDRLHLLLEIRQFARNADSAELWLIGKEMKLEAARRQLGEDLFETLTLLGAHNVFAQTVAAAEERFKSLKKLTTLELKSLEWDSEQVVLNEQAKRSKVREAVKEFLPNLCEKPKLSVQQPVQPQPQQQQFKGRIAPDHQPKAIKLTPVVHLRPTSILKDQSNLSYHVAPPKPIRKHYESEQLEQEQILPTSEQTKQQISSSDVAVPRRPSTAAVLEQVESEISEDSYQKAQELPFLIKQTSSESADNAEECREKSLSVSSTISIKLSPKGNTEPSSYAESSSISRKRETLEEMQPGPDQMEGSMMGEFQFSKLEGPVIRKHDLDAGGQLHSKSKGRSWSPLYLLLEEGNLHTYKNYQSRKAKPTTYYHNEPPTHLLGAVAAPALDYNKRPHVFRLRLADQSEYLFQTANEQVMNRWVMTINETANLLRPSSTLSSSHQTQSSSLRFEATSAQKRATSHRRSFKQLFLSKRK